MSVIRSKSPTDLKKFERLVDRCARCGKGPSVTDNMSGESFCSNCGYVIKEKISETGPEWQAFSQEERNERSHTGSPRSLAMHDMGLSTVMGAENKDASGKSLQASMRSTFERLRTWDRRSQVHASDDRNMRQAFSELGRLSDKLNVNEVVVEKSAYIYRKALDLGLVRGRSISGLIAAALYAACRNTETPRTLKDVSTISGIRKKEVARCYRILFRELDLRMPVVDPIKCIARIASKVGLQERTKRRAMEILRRAEEDRSSAGKDPMGLAASALYVACVLENENKTQKDVADAASVTEVTIRNRQKGLRAILEIKGDFPPSASQ